MVECLSGWLVGLVGWLVGWLAASPASPQPHLALGPSIGFDFVAVGSCWAGLSGGLLAGLTSRLLLGRFGVDFEWVWVRLELICVRCAAGLAAALGFL